jgi:hypothetical protein
MLDVDGNIRSGGQLSGGQVRINYIFPNTQNLQFSSGSTTNTVAVTMFTSSGNWVYQPAQSATDLGYRIAINGPSISGSLYVSGSTIMTGSLNVTQGITGSLQGTASYATTSSNILGGTTNYIPKWLSATTLGSSVIYENSFNIGIGITNPGAKLAISGSLSNYVLGLKANNSDRGGFFIEGDSGITLHLENGSGVRYLIISSSGDSYINAGNFGIGKTTPNTKLDINGDTTISGSLIVTQNISASSFTGSLQGTASYATTASYARTATVFPYTGSAIITGSLGVTGSIEILSTSSIADTLLTIKGRVGTDTASIQITPQEIRFNNYAGDGGDILSLQFKDPSSLPGSSTLYFPSNNNSVTLATTVNNESADYYGNITLTTVPTASYVTGSIFTNSNSAASASYAITASYAMNGGGSVGPGTINKLAKFTGTSTIGNSSVTDDGTTLTMTTNIKILDPNNPSLIYIGGTNAGLALDAKYGGGYSEMYINRAGTGNQAKLWFTTGNFDTGSFASSGNGWNMGMTNNSGVSDFKIGEGDIYNDSGVALTIQTSSKYVGINKVSPQYNLDVSGSGNFSDGLTVTGSLTISGSLAVSGSINGLQIGLGNLNDLNSISIGQSLMNTTGAGQYNISIGYSSSFNLTTGQQNTVIGYGALKTSQAGSFNTTVGLNSMVYASCSRGVAVGYETLASASHDYNVALGFRTLRALQSGSFNTGFGGVALQNITSGSGNTAIGYGSIGNIGTGSFNTAIGFTSLNLNGRGTQNTSIGAYAGALNATGSGNVFIGYSAGYNETGNDKLYIANSSTTTPLIKGEFASGSVTIQDILILPPRTTTPTSPITGSIIISGSSGANLNLYIYTGYGANAGWAKITAV